MSKITFNPNNTEQLIVYLESLNSIDDLLENSALIYSSELDIKKGALENAIRFGSLSMDELNAENTKLNTLMNNILLNNMPVSEGTQVYLTKMSKLVKTKIANHPDINPDKRLNLLNILEESLFDASSDYTTHKTPHPMYGNTQAIVESLNVVTENNKITASALLDICRNYFMSSLQENTFENFTQSLTEKVLNTAEYEMCHEDYHDIPIRYVLTEAREILLEEFADKSDEIEKINNMFDTMEVSLQKPLKEYAKKVNNKLQKFTESDDEDWDDIEDEGDDKDDDDDEDEDEKGEGHCKKKRKCKKKDDDENEEDDDSDDDMDDDSDNDDDLDWDFESVFNPNPFASIYSMTPLPVASRTLSRSAMECLNSTTESELIESLNNFGRLMTVYEVFGEDIVTEANAGSVMNKARRAMARGGAKVAAAARGARKAKDQVKDTGKRIVDPMIRFVEDTYDKIAKADIDERKKIVMTTGFKGKLAKVLKLAKDIIIAIAAGAASAKIGFTAGTAIAAISLVIYFVRNATLDANARALVKRELEDELKLVKEKIEDAKGDENKQKKYELMRIESKLEREIARVKLHLSY